MTELTHLKPVSGPHSVREAVLSLFLAQPIFKPEKFQELVNQESTNNIGYHEFRITKRAEVTFQPDKNGLDLFQNSDPQTVGFSCRSFLEGATAFVLQGVNDIERSFFSFHTLKYERWVPFKDEFHRVMSKVFAIQNECHVLAVSLHYIDEFVWSDASELPLRKIFNEESAMLPIGFLESPNSNYVLNTQKMREHNFYFDRIDITVDSSKSFPTITVSHNVIQELKEGIEMSRFLNEDKFLELVDQIHEYNKKTLGMLFTQEVQKLINLPNPS